MACYCVTFVPDYGKRTKAFVVFVLLIAHKRGGGRRHRQWRCAAPFILPLTGTADAVTSCELYAHFFRNAKVHAL